MPPVDPPRLTEVPDDAVATPVPAGFYWPIWLGVFVCVVWGMMYVFGSHRRGDAGSP